MANDYRQLMIDVKNAPIFRSDTTSGGFANLQHASDQVANEAALIEQNKQLENERAVAEGMASLDRLPGMSEQSTILPTDAPVTQAFGKYNPAVEVFSKGGINYGTDFGIKEGTPLALPAGEWEIINAYTGAQGRGKIGDSTNSGYGNSVVVRNTSTGETMRYSHLSKVNVNPGMKLKGGMVIGASGATGNVTGPHLDLEYKDASGQYRDILSSPYAKSVFGALNNVATNGKGGGNPMPSIVNKAKALLANVPQENIPVASERTPIERAGYSAGLLKDIGVNALKSLSKTFAYDPETKRAFPSSPYYKIADANAIQDPQARQQAMQDANMSMMLGMIGGVQAKPGAYAEALAKNGNKFAKWEINAKKDWLTTDNPKAGAYLTTDGQMIDGSGRVQTSEKFWKYMNDRSVDHREIASKYSEKGGSEAMMDYMDKTNNVRLNITDREAGFDMIHRPTNTMLKKMEELSGGKQISADVTNPANGITIKSGLFKNFKDFKKFLDRNLPEQKPTDPGKVLGATTSKYQVRPGVTKSIHPDDVKDMVKFIDYVRLKNPVKNPSHSTELGASRIAEHYGIKMPNTITKLANEFDKVLSRKK